jgi:predicted phosphohydrolase
MRIFAIGDTHLSRATPKPMDIFGENWRNHDERIRANWNAIASDDDLLVVAGDVSWAMTIAEAEADLEFLASFRGKKLLLKGNHDFWWSSISAVRSCSPPGIEFLQNDAHFFGDVAVVGSRGWRSPQESTEAKDARLYEREVERFRLSAAGLASKNPRFVIAVTHFPPLQHIDERNSMTLAIEDSGASVCVYGHLHGTDIPTAVQGLSNGVDYRLVSADAVDFVPRLVYEPSKPCAC